MVSAVTVCARSNASLMKSRSSAVARYLSGALRIDGTSPCAATRSSNRIPVCDCVFQQLACCAALAEGRCAQRGLSEFVILPSGRSHLASLFGNVMHQCARRCLVLLRWVLALRRAALLHWSQTRRSDGVSAAAFLQWSCQTSGTIMAHVGWLVSTARSASLPGCFNASVLQPLASPVFAAYARPLSTEPRYRLVNIDHGFLLRCSAARDRAEVR